MRQNLIVHIIATLILTSGEIVTIAIAMAI